LLNSAVAFKSPDEKTASAVCSKLLKATFYSLHWRNFPGEKIQG